MKVLGFLKCWFPNVDNDDELAGSDAVGILMESFGNCCKFSRARQRYTQAWSRQGRPKRILNPHGRVKLPVIQVLGI